MVEALMQSMSRNPDAIALPTIPQGVTAFYAVNKIGAVASMIHPLSAAREMITSGPGLPVFSVKGPRCETAFE